MNLDDAAHIPCHLSQLARENLKNDFSTKKTNTALEEVGAKGLLVHK